jgi:hypothetical protein
MKAAIFPVVILLALAASADDVVRTIVTSDGSTYTGARVTELRPTGVVISTDAGVAVISYAQLPKDLQCRYMPDAQELAKAIGKSLNGAYEMPHELTGFGGHRIVLSNGAFLYQSWSDVIGVGGELRGRFTLRGHWITFHHPDVPNPYRVLAVVNGRLAMLLPEDYKLWRETGSLDRVQDPPLSRVPSK